MHHSVYIEITIVSISFIVALVAIWRLHFGEQYIQELEAENTALNQQLDEFRGNCREIANGMGLRYGNRGNHGKIVHAQGYRLDQYRYSA